MTRTIFLTALFSLLLLSCTVQEGNERVVQNLEEDWKFINQDFDDAHQIVYDDSQWENVKVPHDWAVYGPFDKENDAQIIQVYQDGEKKSQLRTGRTGGLPHIGIGWYRKDFKISEDMKGRKLFVEFDGAMSHAKVYLNGQYIGERPYGYVSFGFDLTEAAKFGENNVLAVRLENTYVMSRWYPGAGIYRDVRLVYTNPTHIKKWGTYITTPKIAEGLGNVNIETIINGHTEDAKLSTEIIAPNGKTVSTTESRITNGSSSKITQKMMVKKPIMWSLEEPKVYTVLSKVIVDETIVDTYTSTFGFRYIEFKANDGFHLNGERVQIKGVCMHHDLGPIGTAFNVTAAHRQLRILKEMGCNAIRTSHNMPDPQLLNMCDTMGLLVDNEAFDEWNAPKTKSGYFLHFDEWAERDLVDFIHRDRNHPSVIMWSLGNEIPDQKSEAGVKTAKQLVEICHREDNTRPTTIGMNNHIEVLSNGFAAQMDVKGFNYHTMVYDIIDKEDKGWCVIAAETASTVSSRGYYDFPAIPRSHYTRDNLQSSSYDMEYPRWANSPDKSFAIVEDHPSVAGEFVWTGFDYLGEPTPHNEGWPTKNSYFGIVDLCGFVKDRYYLYQSHWSDKEVLHILPHWNWKGREGLVTPIHVYTSYNAAELFVNGISQGIREKSKDAGEYGRYRLVWDDVVYQPGEVKVVALNENKEPAKEKIVVTTGAPKSVRLSVERNILNTSGEDLAFVTAEVVDENGIPCPDANNWIEFKVEGEGFLRATGNGNSADITSFQSSKRQLFSGKCLAIINANKTEGDIKIMAVSEGLLSADITLSVK